MRSQIQNGKRFNIISRGVDNATGCSVIDVADDCFKVKLDLPGEFEKDETVEFFGGQNNGRLYFETIVKEVNGDILSIWFPIIYKNLQRREYSRIKTETPITLKDKDGEITVKVFDISAGGLKVHTKEQLELLKSYTTEITVDNKKIVVDFEPIRSETYGNNGYIFSGRFKNLSNYDRIALVQYCFVKQIELQQV